MKALHDAIGVINESKDINARMLERERPLIEFHEGVASANDSDIRMYWDIRLVRGKDTPFTQVIGSSSMPGMLSGKLRSHASAQIEQEVRDKISGPLVAVFMEEDEQQNSGTLRRIASMRLVESATPVAPPDNGEAPTDGVLALANQHSQDTNGNAPVSGEGDDDEP